MRMPQKHERHVSGRVGVPPAVFRVPRNASARHLQSDCLWTSAGCCAGRAARQAERPPCPIPCLSGWLTNQSEVMLRKRTSGAWIYCAGMNWQRRARRGVAQAPLPAVSQRLRLAPRAGRLEACDTADWKSALRSLREPPAIGSSLAAEFRRGRRRRTERSRSIPCDFCGCPDL